MYVGVLTHVKIKVLRAQWVKVAYIYVCVYTTRGWRQIIKQHKAENI